MTIFPKEMLKLASATCRAIDKLLILAHMSERNKVITTMVIRSLDDPHTMCSICLRRFASPLFGVRFGSMMVPIDSLPMSSYSLPIDTHLTVLELFSWLQNRFSSSVCPSGPDAMTNTALEATASSSIRNTLFRRRRRGWMQFAADRK